MLTQEKLKEVLFYNCETGIFTWKVRKAKRIQIGDVTGSPSGKGYLSIVVNGKNYLAHHLAWLYVYGYLPKRIDHINTIVNNNWIENLREATQQQNTYNSNVRITNKLGVKGVDINYGKFRAQIRINGKKKHLGLFNTLNEAKYAYDKAAKEAFGEFYRR